MPPRIPNGKSKHAAQLVKTMLTPTAVSFEQHFGIGMAAEFYPLPFQSLANLAEVVDFAVVDDPVPGLGILHGLVAQRRQIEDGKAPAAQADFNRMGTAFLKYDRAVVVGSTVGKRQTSALQKFRSDLGIAREDADDAAHNAMTGVETTYYPDRWLTMNGLALRLVEAET